MINVNFVRIKTMLKKLFKSKVFLIIFFSLIYWGSLYIVYNQTKKSNEKDICKIQPPIEKRINEFTIKEQLSILRKTHQEYVNSSKETKIIRWITRFSNSKYRNDGNSRYNNYDCSSAVIHYLWEWGSMVEVANPQGLRATAVNLAAVGELEIRKTYDRVQPGDVIIFNPVGRSWHCGIVWNKSRGFIQYMDINAKVWGMGFDEVRFISMKNKDRKINMIFEVSFSFWIGNLINKK